MAFFAKYGKGCGKIEGSDTCHLNFQDNLPVLLGKHDFL
ncbi:hypothetical protein RR45_GL001174 [Lactococcus chungangensis CAU 28 = DSM 22330]|uniref:Uncharacterized protein n=1 Tax=Pseudolactococcus chungangensis CAU 28 = DSM 22330 TaxID=1122154 RepID=A0ABX4I4U4_9LACT|nr:hypothetical protein RR45_GL001174 [Lactococcus chungangensis CAU 28 = DSM 22330]